MEKNKELESIEIYPYIVVYKNIFKDHVKTFNVLEDSTKDNHGGLFKPWAKWSDFGEYLSPIISSENGALKYLNLENITPKNKTEEDQKNLIVELIDGFYNVTSDYCKKYNVDLNLESKYINSQGKEVSEWKSAGPSIARYKKGYTQLEVNGFDVAMFYHTDFIVEPMESEGHKFVITALYYFNDDYEGGEIEFAVGKKLIRYKPKAGDYLVFPSGNPSLLTEDGQVFVHAVLPMGQGNNKYISRMYWEKYFSGSDEWHAKRLEYGDKAWEMMYNKLKEQYSIEHPQRSVIEDGVRVL